MRMSNILSMQVVPAGGSLYVTGLLEAAAPHSQESAGPKAATGRADRRENSHFGTQYCVSGVEQQARDSSN